MKAQWKILLAGITIGLLLAIGLLLGMAIMNAILQGNSFQTKETSSALATCEFANDLIDLINLQSTHLEICNGLPVNNYFVRLSKLNCFLLK